MPRESIMTGKTVDEALRKAKEELGVTEEETGFEILEMPRSSFFGLKKTPAKVRVYLIGEQPPAGPAEKPAAQEARPARPAPRMAQPRAVAENRAVAEKPQRPEKPVPAEKSQREEKPQKPEKPPKRERAEAEAKPAPEKKPLPKPAASPKPEGHRPRPEHRPETAAQEEPRSFTPEDQLSEKAKTAIRYVSDILSAMGVKEAVVRARQTPESIDLYLEGSGLGVIIGRRGETLDAVQYLTSLVANRVDGEYVRISIDSGDYRQKRIETLERLAQKLARNAVKSGRSTRLEPMNPYERRIIHAAVSRIEGATSSSIGEEPNRRVVISPKNPRRKQEGEAHGAPRSSGSGPRGRGRDGAREGGRRFDRPHPARPAAPAGAEKINDGDIEIPQELAPKPLAAPQPVQKAAAEPRTPTAEEKDALPLYGKMDL